MPPLIIRTLMTLTLTARLGAGGADAATPATIQCAPYARERSGIQLSGDANLWWEKAAGVYARGKSPQVGAVILLHQYSQSGTAHVAVVTRVVSAREIRIDHANWMNDGAIYHNNPVADVSPENDWSQVRVWNIRGEGWGEKIYPVRGFIAHIRTNQARTETTYAIPDIDARNPSADSRFALTDEDLSIPFLGYSP